MQETVSILKDLGKYLGEIIENTSSVVAVYLFGSYAKEKGKPHSDIDLAFLLDEKAYKINSLEAILPAYTVSMQAGMMFNKETDVLILNSSSVELSYQVVTSGRCIYDAEQDKRLAYEIKIRGLYYDFRPFLMELRSKSLERF